MVLSDDDMLAVARALFASLYEYRRRAIAARSVIS